ncbi:MAG: hypothetical protein DWH91_04285 [Planctomycetota bacterium]|nr:MAG: hypothetical protein DWH91_04285 [Planctomycetota bacterium]
MYAILIFSLSHWSTAKLKPTSDLVTISALATILITTLMSVKLIVEAFFGPGVIPALCVVLTIDMIAVWYLFRTGR